jgi:hypothetical protein
MMPGRAPELGKQSDIFLFDYWLVLIK